MLDESVIDFPIEITTDGNFSSVVSIGNKYVTWEYESEKYLIALSQPGLTHLHDIPNDITAIRIFAFSLYRDSIKSVILPDSVKTVGWHVFDGCKNLEYVDLGGVTYVGGDAFCANTSLKTVVLSKEIITFHKCNFGVTDNIENVIVMNPEQMLYIESQESAYGLYYKNADFYIFAESGVSSNYSNNVNNVYYYSETQKAGNYWHFVDGVATKWN